jgi:Rod binding domain-containing protein
MIDPIAGAAIRPNATIATPKTTKDAAQQFEALLIGELMKASRSDKGWLGTGEDDQAGQMGVEIAEQEFARMLAQKGGLGIGKMVEKAVK